MKKSLTTYEIDYTALVHELKDAGQIQNSAKAIKKSRKEKAITRANPDEPYVQHSAESIKDPQTIAKIRQYYLDKENYRDHMLFVVGISVGLRVSDLLSLKFIDVMDKNLNYRPTILVPEQKTGKKRIFSLSSIATNAIDLYINKQLHNKFSLSDYLFTSFSVTFKYTYRPSTHMDRSTAFRALDSAFTDLHLPYRHGTHLLRKTFAYQVLTSTNDAVERARRLEVLQHMLNHSSPQITLRYAGITTDEESFIYKNLTYDLAPIPTESIASVPTKEEIAKQEDTAEITESVEPYYII